MKALSTGNIHKKGGSTLEILIAFAILTLALSATAMVIFGNQYAALAAQLNQEALYKAQGMLEEARATSRFDINLVVASTSTDTSGSLVYTKMLSVSQIDLYLKQVTSTVSWSQHGRVLSVSLSTILGDSTNVQGGSTCSSVLTGNWNNPQLGTPIAVGSSVDGNPVTGLTVFNKKIYITTSNTHGHNDDFYIYDTSVMPESPTYLSSMDANIVTPGLNAVAFASTTEGAFAYVANANTPNWSTCNAKASCAQVQVISVNNPSSLSVIKNIKIPATSTPFVTGSGGQGIGNTVTYKNGYLYIGLTKTQSGPEFVIYDVGAGAGSPTNPKYVGSYAVGRGVNTIVVARGFAYLATNDNVREVLVLDVHTPSSPVAVGLFNAPGSLGFGAGYSLSLIGNTLYLGRNYVSNAPELFVLNVSTPASVLPAIASVDVGISSDPQSINGIVIRSTLAFLVTTDFLQIYNIANSVSPTLVHSLDVSSDGSVGAALACEGNYLYVGAYRSVNDKGVIYAVYPGV